MVERDSEVVEPVETTRNDRAEPVDTTTSETRRSPYTTAELLEQISGTEVDSPLCFTCGRKMRPPARATCARGVGEHE